MKYSTKQITHCAMMLVLMVLCGRISIPLPYAVPLSLQMYASMLCYLLLGSQLGLISHIAYIGLGLAGLPVFAAGGGIGYVLLPSFGYLVGMMLGGYVGARFFERNEKTTAQAIRCCLCVLTGCYLIGMPHLALSTGLLASSGVLKWLYGGMLIFLPVDAIKIILAITSYRALQRAKSIAI